MPQMPTSCRLRYSKDSARAIDACCSTSLAQSSRSLTLLHAVAGVLVSGHITKVYRYAVVPQWFVVDSRFHATGREDHLYTPRRRKTSVLTTETIFSAASVRRMICQVRGAHVPGGARSCITSDSLSGKF